MSAFTTQIRFICESKAGLKESVGYDNIAQVIAGARPAIFDFPYPIFDETYRAVLETKILKHYYTREIGEETYGLWKLRLDTKMNEIMPYYNQLYKSTLLEFNPLYDVDINRTHNATRKGTEILNGNVGMTCLYLTDRLTSGNIALILSHAISRSNSRVYRCASTSPIPADISDVLSRSLFDVFVFDIPRYVMASSHINCFNTISLSAMYGADISSDSSPCRFMALSAKMNG